LQINTEPTGRDNYLDALLLGMSGDRTRHWVEKNMTIGGITIVSNIEIGKRAVSLF
jgi:hypothetical protein